MLCALCLRLLDDQPDCGTDYLWLGLVALVVNKRDNLAAAYAVSWALLSHWLALRPERTLVTAAMVSSVTVMFALAVVTQTNGVTMPWTRRVPAAKR